EIELQAILALKRLAWFIVFLIDPTETCGYSVKNQISLLEEISHEFSDIEIMIVLNKRDLWSQFPESVEKCKSLLMKKQKSFHEISAETGLGVDVLATNLDREILELYRTKKERKFAS
ncbi:MAG: hypothetical protein DRN92_02935, partial [Thermoproteota archaeon]